jgi:serine/threonine protein kinase
MIRLGPFVLDARVGSGGMAEVWRATHASGTPVAIKVMTDSLARSPKWRAGFMREIRATAGLDHSHIVRVFDAGLVPAEGASVGLVPGSPWVAMELAERGDLASSWPVHWGALRQVLFEVLDALAHAHARGVIHRDLKPGNILIAEADGRPSFRLTDFGIAHVSADRPDDEGAAQVDASGTPEYMAPEQVSGQRADQGPWTDLYALGCVAFHLCSGRPPFEGETALSIAVQHLNGVAPPLTPRFPVPSGFEDWIARLMQRAPADRFACAADAAYALMQLRDDLSATPDAFQPEALALRTLVDTVASLHTMALSVDDICWSAEGTPGAESTQPPLPSTWRSSHPLPTQGAALKDAGLGLLGVRRPTLVGRAAEWDALWTLLAQTHAGGPARLAIVHGPHGIGTSSLARAFCERAVEVGGAELFVARHQPIDTPDDGIGAMLRRHFGATHLDDDAARAHVERRVDGPDAANLAEAALWHAERSTRFETQDVRHAVVRRYLTTRAAQRPVLVFVDEAQWGGDTLTFVRSLLRGEPARILVVLAYDADGAEQSNAETRTR